MDSDNLFCEPIHIFFRINKINLLKQGLNYMQYIIPCLTRNPENQPGFLPPQECHSIA